MMKRGASLVWAVVLCSMMMLVSGTAASFIISESKMSVRMDDSARAYAAAESGLEWAKICLLNISCKSILESREYQYEGRLSSATYEVTVVPEVDHYKINSKGTSNSVNREIEYIFKEAAPTFIDQNEPTNQKIMNSQLSIDGSFTLDFNYWVEDSVVGSEPLDQVTAGVKDASGQNYLGVLISENSIDLNVKENGTIKPRIINLPQNYKDFMTLNGPISIDPAKYDEPYALKVSLKYVQGTSLQLTVTDDVLGECIGTKTVFLEGSNFLTFKNGGARFMFDGAGVNPITRIQQVAIPGINNDPSNYLYKLTQSAATPRVGYFDDFISTGIKYDVIVQFSASVTSNINQGVSVSPTTVAAGGSVTFTAAPQAGFTFSNWSVDCSGSSDTFTINDVQRDVSCTANYTSVDWISNSNLPGLFVYNADNSISATWQTSNVACTSPYCVSGVLSSDNNLIYSSYPARDICKAVGGRLPTRTEMTNIINLNNSSPGTFGSTNGTYWTSEQYDATRARVVTQTGASNYWLKSQNTFRTRCVK